MPGPYPFSERSEMLPFLPTGVSTVLDVGCHHGGFGKALRDAGTARTLWAVEADAGAAKIAETNYDRVIVGHYPDALADADMRFDCIIFNDVLEHMVDPWATLRATAAHLAPEGTVVASIPNVRHIKVVANLLLRGDWTYTDMGILDRTHLRFFTAKTIRALFTDCGFTVERLEGINPIGHLRSPFWRWLPLVLGDLAYTGFAVTGRPDADR
jgi:2-polyprenyl-3-methyl-5-hydroxy-6-metoxy-1,4-benzoquinol methylase